MPLSIKQLRENFKKHLEWCEQHLSFGSSPKTQADNNAKLLAWGQDFEKKVESKIQYLERSLQNYTLKDEYLRSITESLDDLDRIRSTHKTIADIIKTDINSNQLLADIKNHYNGYFVPLLNILAKLENDYLSLLNKSITEKLKIIKNLELQKAFFEKQKDKLKKAIFAFNKKEKYHKVSTQIKIAELSKKFLLLSIQHDKLDLQFENLNCPNEVQNSKAEADALRDQIIIKEGATHGI